METTEANGQAAPRAGSPLQPSGSPAMEDQPPLEHAEEEFAPDAEPVTKIEDLTADVPMSEVGISPDADLEVPPTPIEPSPPPPSHAPVAGPTTAAREEVKLAPNYATRYIMSGHTRSISTVKFNPEGTILASAGKRVVHILHLRIDN